MAAGMYPCVCSSEKNYNNAWNFINSCESCILLKTELNKVTSELKSAWEIIRILQDTTKTNTDRHVPRPTDGKWIKVQNGCRSYEPVVNNTVSTKNRFITLQENQDRGLKKEDASKKKKKQSRNLVEIKCVNYDTRPKSKEGDARKQKVVVIGDSHARDCASNIIAIRKKKDLEVCGYVNPGMCLNTIIHSGKEEIKNMTKKDVVVVWSGTNDISKNNTDEAQKILKDFVVHNKQTNIIIMSAPQRHDFSSSSCINNEVETYNRKMKKRMKVYEHVCVVDVYLKREHFTRHGLHMNYKGKEEAARTISSTIDCINNKVSNSIPLQWYDNNGAAQEKVEQKQASGPSTRSSTRTFKPPSHLGDFLCQTTQRKRTRNLSG